MQKNINIYKLKAYDSDFEWYTHILDIIKSTNAGRRNVEVPVLIRRNTNNANKVDVSQCYAMIGTVDKITNFIERYYELRIMEDLDEFKKGIRNSQRNVN